ncbi:endo-1,4-beta-xylanase [Lachnoclostridium phytofermentans]|uniref:Beta-xylanase n=1 Tax=Lachnoclostridium phytofermentans (strain ATCC 700394 / DSM 18823 / ISDg) TaxID=357809 RepID=A9KJ62_LACP7|nr:endo-1,4-beta-xylanase [Lachnoclostridium phytofermentans]ABX42474.1 Endo-1,4-beta-xylanase [Lachnoclostridium phytofermentans ISDg]
MGKKVIALLTCVMLSLTLIPGIGIKSTAQAAETNIYKVDWSKFNEGDKISGPMEGLGRSGGADITVTGSSTKSFYISNRKDNWDALDIQNDLLKLDRDATYEITVTGHVDSNVDTKNASVKLGGVTRKTGEDDGYPEFKKEKLQSGKSFVLTYELKLSDQIPDASRNLWVLRVQTDEPSGSRAGDLVPFYVDDIVIIQTKASTAPVAVTGDLMSLYELNADKTLKVGESLSSPALKVSGNAKIVVVEGTDGTVSLQLKDRVNNYDGVDILRDALKINDKFMSGTYTIEVKGHVEDGSDLSKSQFVMGMTESPWGELTSRVTPSSDGSFVITYTKAYTGSELTGLGYSYRVQTPPSVLTSFYIDNITVTVQGAEEEDESTVVIPEWDLTLDSIKDAYADYFMIGNIMEPGQIQDTETTEMFKHHYNVVTAENAMKPGNISKVKGEYNFDNADKLVTWAKENGLKVHGHTLVWHSQSAPWLTTNADGTPLTRAEARANMEDYIKNVAGHYAGKVISWDVLNEAFLPGVSEIPAGWRDVLRKFEDNGNGSPWYQAYENGADKSKGEDGSDYIYDAFVFTRLAAPDAVLYYNDFNETEAGKCEAIALMVEELNTKWKTDKRNTEPDRLLIEGIGMQAHYWTGDLKVSTVEASIKRFIKTGAKISVSELDVPHGDYMTYKQRTDSPTKEEEKLQADLYKQLFEVYKKYADNIERVTFWGKTDPQSWRFQGYPLLFDKNFAPKDAFFAVIDVAKEKVAEEKAVETIPGKDIPKTGEDSSKQMILTAVAILIILVFVPVTILTKRREKNIKNI